MARAIVRLTLLAGLAFGAYLAYGACSPVLADPWFRADTAWRLGLYDRALPAYARAVSLHRKHPRIPEAELRIAECLHRLGRHQPAYLAYQAFVARYPSDPHTPIVLTNLEAYATAYLP